MKPARAVCFDLDATLLDGSVMGDVIARSCGRIAANHAGLDAARLAEANGDAWRSYWPRVEHEWMLGGLSGESVILEVWRRALRACGCGDASLAARALRIHQQEERQAYRPFDDVHDVIGVLRRARVPLALITNGASDTQREKLRALRAEAWFDAVVISGEARVAKPDPAVFRHALSALALEPTLEPAHVWHVGDNLSSDVAGAKSAGLTAVWLNRCGVPRKEGDPEPDVEIRSLSELTASWSASGVR